jgi:uroporphyrinogen decarboxylase
MATDLEVFRDTVNHRRPERFLYHFDCTPDLQSRLRQHVGGDGDYGRHYGMFMQADNGMRRPENLPRPDYSKYWHGQELPPGTTIGETGVAAVPSGFYHFVGLLSPLRNATSLKDMEEYPLDDATQWDYSGCAAAVARAHAEGKVVSGWAGHMYEVVWPIRGYEQFLMDMVERPAWCECLLDRVAAGNMHRAVQFAKAGVDILYTADDVANQQALMFQPSLWRTMMLSRWAKIWDAVHRIHPKCQIWYHTDGNPIEIIPDLVDAGLNILNPLQPECLDVDKVYRDFGHVLSFDGTIGTQSTMPWGTPRDVKARVKEVIDQYGRHGGLIISPTHTLEPEVPLANIDAFVEACREFGANP